MHVQRVPHKAPVAAGLIGRGRLFFSYKRVLDKKMKITFSSLLEFLDIFYWKIKSKVLE